MAKLTLTDIVTLANQASSKQAINDNAAAIEAAFENTLSRDGKTPNAMMADLDMGEHTLLNVADPEADLDGVNLRSVRKLVDKYAGEIAELIIEGTRRVETFIATAGQQDFTLTDSPGLAANMLVTDNHVVLDPVVDYTLIGSDLKTLHFNTGRALNARIVARYEQLAPSDGILRGDLAADASNKGSALVTYKHPATDTFSRPLGEVLATRFGVSVLEWIPRNMHAAITDKTTTADHTAYIQKAIDILGAAKGGTLYFPPGLYNISAKLDVPYEGVQLVGAGGGHYTSFGIESTRQTAATRIAWIGTTPLAGVPMLEFRTPAAERSLGRGGVSDLMLDGKLVARIGVAITSYNYGIFRGAHVYGCLEDGFLLRQADYDLAQGAGATQFNSFYDCAVTAFAGSGGWLTNACNGWRFTGPKWGAGGVNATQTGDASGNALYSPRCNLATGTSIIFEGVGQNQIFSLHCASWNSSGPDVIFGSTDQDSNWPPSGGVTHAKASAARYNVIYWCEAQVRAKASQNTNGVPSFGNMIVGLSHGNAAPVPTLESPGAGTLHPEILYQSMGNFTGDASRTALGGFVEIVAQDNSAAINPALFLKKGSDVGTNGDGLGKIQWRMTNANGQVDIDAGRINATITSATAGAETARMALTPMYNGSEVAVAMAWQNGVIVQDEAGPTLAFQGFGTVNVNGSYWVDNVKVLGGRVGGWTKPTGTATRTAFNTATVTTAQLAERVKALIDDIYDNHGFIGA